MTKSHQIHNPQYRSIPINLSMCTLGNQQYGQGIGDDSTQRVVTRLYRAYQGLYHGTLNNLKIDRQSLGELPRNPRNARYRDYCPTLIRVQKWRLPCLCDYLHHRPIFRRTMPFLAGKVVKAGIRALQPLRQPYALQPLLRVVNVAKSVS